MKKEKKILVVKFKGSIEPCTVYRIVEGEAETMYSAILKCNCPHIKIEVVGWIPAILLCKIAGAVGNVYALDRMLRYKHSLN